ncbi:MAG: hypothetical protein R3B13_13705 [Polyangiaceae bacterium]
MDSRLRIIAIAASATLLVTESYAASDVPARLAPRTMTLPKANLRLDNGAYWPLPQGLAETTFVKIPDGRDTFTRVNFGFGIGIVPNLELGFHVIRWDLEPESDLRDPSAYVIYRFLRRDVELGVFGEVSLPLQDRERITAGMPVAFHLGDAVRLDTGPFIVKRFQPGDDPDLVVPFELPISPSDHVYLGPEVGLMLRDFDRSDGFVGFFAGYTLRNGGRALGDLGGRFRMPSTRAGFDVFQLQFEMRFYFGL